MPRPGVQGLDRPRHGLAGDHHVLDHLGIGLRKIGKAVVIQGNAEKLPVKAFQLDHPRHAFVADMFGDHLLDHIVAEGFVQAAEGFDLDLVGFDQHTVEIEEYRIDVPGIDIGGGSPPGRHSAAFPGVCVQRAVAASSESRASTHWPPPGVPSSFQNGALVLRKSIRK